MNARSRHATVARQAEGHQLSAVGHQPIRRAASRQPRSDSRFGFTLVELLVVIAVIGVLVALLLPAVQESRESARRVQCKNNLKQMSVGFLHHESVQGHLPTGGWGHRWIGEPDAGYGEDQPGSWAYNILAYIEQESLRTLGSGIANLAVDPLNMDHQAALMQLVRTPVAVFNCPSKRPLDVWPYASDVFMAQNLFMCSRARNCFVMRGDYRVNGGSINAGGQTGPGLAQNPDIYDWALIGPNRQNGICTQRSRIRISQVSDGAAKTFMIGEKYLNTKRYFDGEDPSDDQCVYAGHDRDNVGYTAMSFDEIYPPLLDEPTNDKLAFRFGGPHRAGVNMALCDGSVHTFAYDIDELAWKYYGGRNDESPE